MQWFFHRRFENESWEKYELNKQELSKVYFDLQNSGLYSALSVGEGPEFVCNGALSVTSGHIFVRNGALSIAGWPIFVLYGVLSVAGGHIFLKSYFTVLFQIESYYV